MSKQASIAIKYALDSANVKRSALAAALGVANAQSINDKLSRGRWSADELATAAELCGYSLALVDKAGRVAVSVPASAPPADDGSSPADDVEAKTTL